MSEPRSNVEQIKEQSRGLRGTIADELAGPAPALGGAAQALIKHHGVYQQDDRDRRAELRQSGRDKAYSFMVRSKIPAGRLTAEQYLVHDDLATRFANGSLRITTRQDFQLHGVIRGGLHRAIRTIHESLLTTLGACGDVVRNVTCCPLPSSDPVRQWVEADARRISERFLPRTRAYHEIWLDGERVADGEEEQDPIYGATYLPRKFKIGIAHPHDNCVDVFTQDLGLVPVTSEGDLAGYVLLVGGGQGMTHNKPETFPRLADPLAFVPRDALLDAVEQIVAVQRDFGDRADRRHARLKYLIHDAGLPWFRSEVERRLGHALDEAPPLPPFELRLHLGWGRDGSGRDFLGIPVENGRIRDEPGARLRTALREVVEWLRPGVRLTPGQNLLLTDLEPGRRMELERRLRGHGVRLAVETSNARLYAMACPALPTCGLALAEAERALPAILDRLERELARLGLERERLAIRMTGCPNGCARPYVADLAFVGRSADRYAVFVGGRRDGTRLNRMFRDLVEREHLVDCVLPLFVYFRRARRPAESFGDFCDRVGVEVLRELADGTGAEGVCAHG